MTTATIQPAKSEDVPPTYAASVSSQNQQEPSTEMPNDATHEKRRSPSRFSQRFHSISGKAGWPLNKAANLIGAEGWWPTSMTKECNKAARILHSFTRLQEPPSLPSASAPMHPTGITRKSMVKIPNEILQNCAGLAIFNVIRVGAMHGSLAAGSGVVISRREDGTWSPPSSFVVSTLGAGFVFGLDVYDCVCVLNSRQQVAAFTRPRVSLGGDASIAIGPIGTGASIDAALSKSVRPMWSYMKSRGLWAGVQIDGTVIVSRADANAIFYNQRGISAKQILLGDIAWPMNAKPLFEVLRALDGKLTVDRSVVQEVSQFPSPGDKDGVDVKILVEAENAAKAKEEDMYDDSIVDEKEKLRQAGF